MQIVIDQLYYRIAYSYTYDVVDYKFVFVFLLKFKYLSFRKLSTVITRLMTSKANSCVLFITRNGEERIEWSLLVSSSVCTDTGGGIDPEICTFLKKRNHSHVSRNCPFETLVSYVSYEIRRTLLSGDDNNWSTRYPLMLLLRI